MDAGQRHTAVQVTNLDVIYRQSVRAVRDVSFVLREATLTALLGANGAGKTSVLRALTGLLPFEGGLIANGDIRSVGRSLSTDSPERIARLGIAHVPQGRRVFARMTVEENLLVGGHCLPRGHARTEAAALLDAQPALARRRNHKAGLLSGGEQQMLAVGRAFMSRPTVLLLDEPTLGLAPKIATEIVATVAAMVAERGIAALLVEQNAVLALRHADVALVMDRGQIVREASADDLADDPSLSALYLGGGVDGHLEPMEAR